MTEPAPRVVLAGGGSAGHVNPLLATAACLRRAGVEVTVLGTAEGLEADLVPAAGYELVTIPKVPLPRRPSGAMFSFPRRWKAAVAAARDAIAGAQAVVGFGGYVATPAYIAARKAGVPIIIHEQNARPGLANRLGARFAHTVALTFPGTPLRGQGGPSRQTSQTTQTSQTSQSAQSGAITVGLPLRPQIAELLSARSADPVRARAAGAQALGLDPARPIILVTGGSLGAQRLNDVVPAAAGALLAAGAQIFHLSGRDKTVNAGDHPDYHVRDYLLGMDQALACADLVIGRAGAGTVAELTALGIPAVYVPLPVGNGEQRLNAADVVTAGGGLLVPDQEFTPEWIETVLAPLLADAGALRTMAERAASAGVTDGADRLTEAIMAVMQPMETQ